MSETDTTPAIGDNAPRPPAPLNPEQIRSYLEYALTALIERRAEMAAALADTLRAHPRIDDDETQGDVAENLRMAKALIRTADDRRVEQKQPYLEGGRAVDAWFKTFGDPLLPSIRAIEAVMLEYSNRVDARRKAAAKAAAEQAEREARRAAEAARAAAPRGELFPDDPAALNRAIEAEEARARADKAQAAANAKPSERTRVRGAYGAVASVRSTWDYEVEDFAAVPDELKRIDPQKVRERMMANRRADGSPSETIPGLRWVEQRSIGVR